MKLSELLDKEYCSPNWEVIESIPEMSVLAKTWQNEKYHKEGDVLSHTKLVCNKMQYAIESGLAMSLFDFSYGDYTIEPTALMLSAILHDIGKGTTTRWDEKENTWKTENHGLEGVRIIRRIFFDDPDVQLRERVCWLVRNHMALHHIFDGSNENRFNKTMIKLSFGNANLLELCLLNYADTMGSISEETEKGDAFVLERLRKVMSEDRTCKMGLNSLRKHYYGDKYNKPNQTSPLIYVMIGIAGSGKTTWIKHNLSSNFVIVSRDIIREELGYTKHGEKARLNGKQEEVVSKKFIEKAMNALENGKSIVIDNLNLKKRYRDQYHNDFNKFSPKFVYVYIEAPTLKDNAIRRNGQISENEINKMLDNLDFPETYEYDELHYVKQAY